MRIFSKKNVLKANWLILGLFVMLPFQNCSKFTASNAGTFSSVVLPSFFQCEASDSRVPDVSPLKRLNKFEMKNTIEDILLRYLTSAEVSPIMVQLKAPLDNIPEDVDEVMSHFDQTLSNKHIDTQILLAEKIADQIFNTVSIRNKVIGSCSSNLSDTNCRDKFINDFGKLVYRRPLSAEDKAWFASVYDGEENGYLNVIASLFAAPYFIYHYEMGGESISKNGHEVVSLGPYERVSKLSYFYLQSLPDEALFNAAEDNSIMTSTGLSKQVTRLVGMRKVQKRLTVFLSDQLFKLEETPEYRTDISSVNTMINNLQTTESLENRREHMIHEVYDFMDYIIWKKRGGFEDLMTSNAVFPRTPDLAEIYGTEVWNGSYNESNVIKAPPSERSGILTRAQLLFTGYESTRPIMRGVRVFNEYLCGELPPPADNDSPKDAVVEDEYTEREFITAITQHPGTSCIGCHTGIINPLGFPFEMYDSFGRVRQKENVYHPETTASRGTILVKKDVASSTEINLGETISGWFKDGIDVTRNLAQNERAKACFSLRLWEFSSKLPHRIGKNDCATASLYQNLVGSKSIAETLQNIPLQPEFFKRTIQ